MSEATQAPPVTETPRFKPNDLITFRGYHQGARPHGLRGGRTSAGTPAVTDALAPEQG